MIYSTIPIWWGQANPNNGLKYDLPIIGHQVFYDQLQEPDGSSVLILEGDQEGYVDFKSIWQPVCKFLGFNPFKLAKYNINQRGIEYSDGMIPELINAFVGEINEPTNYNGNILYPDYAGSNFGPMYYAEGYSSAQAGVGATSYGGGGVNVAFINVIMPMTKLAINDGISYTFEIWPETVFERGYIDTQRFQTDNDLIRSGQIRLDVWKANDKVYFEIYLRSFNYSQQLTNLVNNILNQQETGHVYNPDNPLDNKQADGTEGGTGGFDDGSDPVDIPDLPTLDISDLGGINLYRVTAGDIKALISYLNSAAPGDSILKWFTNPIQAIVSLHVLPYPVEVIGADAIKILGLSATGTAGYKIKQFQEWDLGAVSVPYGFGDNFLDYEPHSKIFIYLPFVGIRQLDMDECVGKSIGVTYQFDNISGSCIVFITINGAVRYSFSGSCAIGVPISQSNWGQTYMAAATIAAGGIAGGVSAGAAAMGGASSIGAVAGQSALGAGAGIAKSSGLGAAIGKPTISRSGSISGAASALGVPYPYLIIERPEQAKVANPAPVIGLASGRTLPLSALSGFNVIEDIHLSGIAATAAELDEIEKLLYQGVIF